MAMIKFENVTIGYEDNIILDNVNINIKKGKITTFLGPNGSGKTSLMSTLTKLTEPVSGSIYIDNNDLKNIKRKDLAKIIAFVPQFHTPKFSYTVFDIILTGRTPYISYLPKKEDIDKVNHAIEKIGIEHLKNKDYTKLSGGERQLVLIARAIAQDTDIILLDEPTSYLDLKNQMKILKTIKDINKENNVTFIMILHDPNHALICSDYIALVNNKNVQMGKADEMISSDIINNIYGVKCDIINHKNYKCVIPNYF